MNLTIPGTCTSEISVWIVRGRFFQLVENPMDRGAWRATSHGVSKSRTRVSKPTHCKKHFVRCGEEAAPHPPTQSGFSEVCTDSVSRGTFVNLIPEPSGRFNPESWRPCEGLWLLSRSVLSDSLRPRGLQHTRPPCPSPSPGACSDLCPWVSSKTEFKTTSCHI